MKEQRYERGCEHARELAKLKLWYIWWLRKHENLDFETAVGKRVGISRMTVSWGDDPRNAEPADLERWQRLLAGLRKLYEEHSEDATSEAIETEGMRLLWPCLEPAVERDLAVAAQWLRESYGCFKYEYHPLYAEPNSGDHLTLHVRNAYQPDSPFRHFPEMAASLREIISRAERERPDVSMVQCATWLNSLPPFARLFPPVWLETSQPGVPGSHTGWWGQFMDRRGGFHAKNGRRFRETGEFPFTHLLCRCTITDLREHLSRR